MINETVAVVGGIVGTSMVQYIMSFFFALGVVSLAIKGALMLSDGLVTTWKALRHDVKEARHGGVSILRLWKDRVRVSLPVSQQ